MQLLREKHLRRCSPLKRLAHPGFILSASGSASSASSKYLPREDALHHSFTRRAPSPGTRTGESRGLHRTGPPFTGRPRLPRGSRAGEQGRAGQGRAGPGPAPAGAGSPGTAPAVPAAPRTAASRDCDGRGARGASPAGRPWPAPPAAAASSSSSLSFSSRGSSAGRRRVSCSSPPPPLRLLRAAGLRQGPFRRLPGMARATATPQPPRRRRRRRHFAGEPAAPPLIGRRRAASGGHWPRAAGWGCGRGRELQLAGSLRRSRRAPSAPPPPAPAAGRPPSLACLAALALRRPVLAPRAALGVTRSKPLVQ